MKQISDIQVARRDEDRERIFRFRYDVYVTEMGKSPAEADHQKKIIRDELDEDAHLLYAEDEGQIVGTVRLNCRSKKKFPDVWEQRYDIEKFAPSFGDHISMTSRMMVARDYRGSSVPAALVGAVYSAGREMGSKFDFCNCAPSLLEFYEQIGFRRFTDGFVDEDNGYHVPLVMVVRDTQYLRQVRSPLYRVARNFEHEPETGAWFQETFPSHAGIANSRTRNTEEFWKQLSDQLADPPTECIPLFESLSDKEVSNFLRSGTVLSLQPGDRIIRQGDVGDEMYIILSGVAEAVSRKEDQEHSLAIMSKGQIFGEVAFISTAVRSADVNALTEMQVLIISKGFLTRAMRKQPEISAKVLFNLSLILAQRLRDRTDSWVEAMTS
jgi:predicted GNAT family N-acyltransferase